MLQRVLLYSPTATSNPTATHTTATDTKTRSTFRTDAQAGPSIGTNTSKP
jgi:hypothetical protein